MKIDMLSLEQEMTSIEKDSLQDEKNNARRNYELLDREVTKRESKIPNPDITEYTTASIYDYEDVTNNQSMKNQNERYIKRTEEIREYTRDGQLYSGHCEVNRVIGPLNVYFMENNHPSRHFNYSDGSEFFLLNVDDKKYQSYLTMWHYPSEYKEVNLSRNIFMSDRNVHAVDIILEREGNNVNDVYSEITDAYLRKALLRNKNLNSIQSIIQTIQEKQNNIRSKEPNVSFYVQGCAGSGKTMVLLHRLRYLLFNEDIKNSEYALLVPSDNFIDFIGELSNNFGISKKNVFTYQEYYAHVLGKELDRNEIKDESVFDKEYLKNIYSTEFMQKCYRQFYDRINVQNELLIDFCDSNLSKKAEFEYNNLKNTINGLEDEYLLKINEALDSISDYIGMNHYSEIDEVVELLELLQDEYNSYYLKSRYGEKSSMINGLEEKILENEVLNALQKQIDNEKFIIEKSSRFTKLTHQKKLLELQNKYESLKIEIQQEAMRYDADTKPNFLVQLSCGLNKIISFKIKSVINQVQGFIKNYEDKKNYLNSVLDEFDEIFSGIYMDCIDKLNEYIENLVSVSDFEVEFVENLLPCKERLKSLIRSGQLLIDDFATNEFFDLENLDKRIKVFTYKTKGQIDSYLDVVLFSIIRSEISKEFKIKINKIYKHYWYLKVFSQYLVGNIKQQALKYIFIDEAQDLSVREIDLINHLNTYTDDLMKKTPIFNLFGDVNQTITSHGIVDWSSLPLSIEKYLLDENFRNTNQIVDYCNQNLPFKMKKVGVDMDCVTEYGTLDEAKFNILNNNNSNVFIVKDEYKKMDLEKILNGYESLVDYTVLTVKEAKGLEFKEIFVIDCEMSSNEKYIAYTRALAKLNVIKYMPLNKNHKNLIINGKEEDEDIDKSESFEKNNSNGIKNEKLSGPNSERILNLLPKKYHKLCFEINCSGLLDDECVMVPYSGKVKKITNEKTVQCFIVMMNKQGEMVNISVSLDMNNKIIFIPKKVYNSYSTALKEASELRIIR